jgi:hypothetical protein
MKAFLGKGKKIPEPFPEPFTTALNRYKTRQFFHVVTGEKEKERREENKGKKEREKEKEREREREEEKKEGKERREDKTKEVFGRSNFECDFFFSNLY